MSTAKDDQRLQSILKEATSLNSYSVQLSNGDKEQTVSDVTALGHCSYTSFYSEPSANGDENLVATDTIELSHTVNPGVKEKDHLVIFATDDEELVTTNAVKLRDSKDYLIPLATVDMDLVTTNVLALGLASDYLAPIATGDKDLVANDVLKLGQATSDYLVPLAVGDKNLSANDVLELGHASDYLSVLPTKDYELVELNQVNICYSDDAQYVHPSPVSTQLSTTTGDHCYSELSAAKPEGKCNLACFKVSFLN